MKNRLAPAAIVAASALALAACSGSTSEDETTAAGTTAAAGEVTTLTIGATPVPHAEILAYVDENLAAEAGIDLEIVEYTDYVQPNVALSEGDLDANYFQHLPYLEDFNAQNNTHIVSVGGIHVEPMGLYGGKQTTLDAISGK